MKQKRNYIKNVNIYKNSLPLWATVLLKSIFITFIICCCFVAIFSFIYIKTPVEGPSMFPTLNELCTYEGGTLANGNRDTVYINRFVGFNYGDIIVIRNPQDSKEEKYVIKRLIAKEGDKISVVEINGKQKIALIKNESETVEILEENYLANQDVNDIIKIKFSNFKTKNQDEVILVDTMYGQLEFVEIPNNEIFYLGDNRPNSLDCLDYGTVSEDKYVGRVDIVVKESKNDLSYIFLYYWHKIFG